MRDFVCLVSGYFEEYNCRTMYPKDLIIAFDKLKPQLEAYNQKLKIVIEDVLRVDHCQFLFIEGRVKSSTSLEQKLKRRQGKSRFNSVTDVQDLVGMRVVTYVYDDIKRIEEVISKNFVAEKLEVEERLGTDKVGYRSDHWLISFSDERLRLPEYKDFIGFKAELQIRTVVQHAWAQIGHNQLYKATAVLPDRIKRDFGLLSGLLEIADNEFARISTEISRYESEIKSQTEAGNLEYPIDTVSLREFFDGHFKDAPLVEPTFGPNDDMAEEIIEELSLLEIKTLLQLDKMVKNLPSNYKINEVTNYCGIARDLMIINNPDAYFSKAWKNKWSFEYYEIEKFRNLKIDIDNLVTTYKIPVDTDPAERPE